MSINEHLTAALSSIAPTAADEYLGDSSTYITFNYSSRPVDFGDDEPGHEVFSVQVHLFCPAGINSLYKRRLIKKSLHDAGFSWPTYINASDRDGQHHVFECEIVTCLGGE